MFFNKLVDVKLVPTGERVAAKGCPDHGTEQRHTASDDNVGGVSLPTRASLATAERHQARDPRMKATAQVIRTSEQPKRKRQVSWRGFTKGLHLKCGPLPITSEPMKRNITRLCIRPLWKLPAKAHKGYNLRTALLTKVVGAGLATFIIGLGYGALLATI